VPRLVATGLQGPDPDGRYRATDFFWGAVVCALALGR